MAHTVEQLAQSFHTALKAQPGPGGRKKICELLQAALRDEAFIASTFSDTTSDRHLLYEDPELGFCIFAHNYKGAKDSPPHDHGPSWAIYGQVQGETRMSDWDLVSPAGADQPGKVRQRKTYQLEPGMAHVYNEGDLHSPSRAGPTRLIRIEGINMEKIKRRKYEVV
jgi:predicted metal-dependent enzyme (double-stranded beta helix superfamily)